MRPVKTKAALLKVNDDHFLNEELESFVVFASSWFLKFFLTLYTIFFKYMSFTLSVLQQLEVIDFAGSW